MSLPIPKKVFKPAWGHVETERNYGELHSCNAAQAGDLTGNNPYSAANGQVASSSASELDGSLPEDWQSYVEPVDRRTWNKRKHDKTGLSASEKLAKLARPAGEVGLRGAAGVALEGLVAPRAFEVLEAPLSSAAASAAVVPADARLVVASASAHTAGASHHVSVAVEWLERLHEGDGGEGAAAADGQPPAERRSFYALLTPHAATADGAASSSAAAGAAPGTTTTTTATAAATTTTAPAAPANDCAVWVARELPKRLAQRLHNVHDSAAIKEAIRAAFDDCDAALLVRCAEEGWRDGCGVAGLLVDTTAAPPRGYVASVGGAQGFACAKEEGALGTGKAIAVCKSHAAAALGAKERARVERGGARVRDGLVGGLLPVARSFGDARAKTALLAAKGGGGGAGGGGGGVDGGGGGAGGPAGGDGGVIIATPEVTSFEIKPAQRFVVFGSEAAWRGGGVAAGQQATDKVSVALGRMDNRRLELDVALGDEGRLAMSTAAHVRAMERERDERAHEAGVLREVVEAVRKQQLQQQRPAATAGGAGGGGASSASASSRDFSMSLVRFLQPKERAAAAVVRAAARAADGRKAEVAARVAADKEARALAEAQAQSQFAAQAAAAQGAAAQEQDAAARARNTAASTAEGSGDGAEGGAEEEEEEEVVDEEERRLLAEREAQRQAEAAKEADNASAEVDFF